MAPKRHKPRRIATKGASYWDLSARPLTSLAFVTPILLVYECGIVVLGPEAMRNGADVWLRNVLDYLGFGQYFLLPLLVCCLLLAWHHLTQQRWRIACEALSLMLIESAILGTSLVAMGEFQAWLFFTASGTAAFTPDRAAVGSVQLVPLLVGFFGAGVYEELLFRLILLSGIAGILQWSGESRPSSIVAAVLGSSVLFSAAHYQWLTPGGDAFNWFSFLFRVLAGVFFSVLFLTRGFGVTVGAHTLYDVFVGILSRPA